ncbi:MAG: phosphotransferase family protein [Candidatus Gracilibacteria bacterium]
MSSLVETYVQYLKTAIDPDNTLGFIIWGSAGRQQLSANSDLDIWIISTSELTFKEAFDLSEKEYSQRQLFGLRHGLKEFSRHRASIFSQEEAKAYLEAFYWRYYLSLSQFSEALTWNYSIPKLHTSQEDIQADLITTLQERLESFAHSRKEKLLFYNLRDYNYYIGMKKGSYFTAPSNEDSRSISKYIELHARQPFLKLAWRRQTHALLWSLEKVRWELFNVSNNPKYFDQWKRGTHGGYGYSLPALGNFLFQLMLTKRCTITLELKELGKLLTQLLHEENTERIPTIYALLTKILQNAIAQPSRLNKKLLKSYSVTVPIHGVSGTSICKISNDEKYIISEYEGQQRYFPSPPQEISLGKMSYIISPFLRGKTYKNEKMNILVSLLKKTHSTKGNFFGRVGTGPYFPSYDIYLQYRIDQISMPLKIKKQLYKAIDILRSELKSVLPVTCHMDPNPGNVLILKNKGTFIDWEHFSYCAKEWDVERAVLDYTKQEQEQFRLLYYDNKEPHTYISQLTKIIVTATAVARKHESPSHTDLYSLYTTELHDLLHSISQTVSPRTDNNSAYSNKENDRLSHRKVYRGKLAKTSRKSSYGL